MAIQNLAQKEADNLGRAVVIYGDEAARAVEKVYKRNPVKSASGGLAVYNAGLKAGRAGKTASSNPYTARTPKGLMWRKGWDRGRK